MDFTIEKNIITLRQQDKQYGFIDFSMENEHLVSLKKVYVNPEYRGQGIAGKLMDFAAATFHDKGYTVRPVCPYAFTWYKRHPQFESEVIYPDQDQLSCQL